jgi:DnaB-like helicase C terminal domain
MSLPQMIDKEYETFFPILHAILRDTAAADQEKENQRAHGVMGWGMGEMVAQLAVVLDPDQKRLMGHILDYWRDYQQGPSRRSLEDMVRADDFPEDQLALLEAFDTFQPQCAVIDPLELPALFKTRKESWARQMFRHVSTYALYISQGQQDNPDPRKPPLKGVKDAIQYLRQEFDRGGWVAGDAPQGGSMKEAALELMYMYQDMEIARDEGSLNLPTGIPLIDETMGGYDRRTLNLIMGHTGHRKSAVARTIAYHAALSGFRVLFIPLEWPYDEEWRIFAMMHAHSLMFEGTEKFSMERFRRAQFTEQEKELMERDLVRGLWSHLGTDLVIRSSEDRTWPAIRQLIEAENARQQLDMVVIDYLHLLDLGDARDKSYLMHQNIRELKQMAIHFNADQGLVVVSPVQCNRAGYKAAQLNDGAWESTDIYLYSEMEKSADTIMYTFMPDDLRAKDEMKIGFCKTRRHGIIAPRVVKVDPRVGLVGGSPVVMAQQARQQDEEFAAEFGMEPPGGPRVVQAGPVKLKKAKGGQATMKDLRRILGAK